MTSLESRELGTANSKGAAWCRPKAGFGFEWRSQSCVLWACHPHSWFPQPRFCNKVGHILTFTAKLSVFSIRLGCPGGNVGRQVLPHWLSQEGPSVFMRTRVTRDPWKKWPWGTSDIQLCLSCTGDASLEAFDISPKCSYVMTLTRSNYCLCSLGVCFFILFSVTSEKRMLKHSNGGLATITTGSWWGLIPFDMNILGRVWKSMNLQDSQTDTQAQYSFEGTKLGSYW